jgi:ribosomal protein S18 acetylase RimI-like enzyme
MIQCETNLRHMKHVQLGEPHNQAPTADLGHAHGDDVIPCFESLPPLEIIERFAHRLDHATACLRHAIIESLWRRGAPGDALAIEAIRSRFPLDAPHPMFKAPGGSSLAVALGKRDDEAAADLVADAYWNDDVTRTEIAAAHRGANAWVGAHDERGDLVATARAISDGVKHAWIFDVAVRSDVRGRGVGAAVIQLLLDHPSVRRVRKVHLGTRDAMTFYEKFGFARRETIKRPYVSTEMVLLRNAPNDAPAK